MIGIDTNVLVRFFVTDDAGQAAIAKAFLNARTAEDPVFVSAVVLAEFVWALKSNYGYGREQVHAVLAILFGSFNVTVEREKLMKNAIDTARLRKADISDCIIAALAQDAGCEAVVTFDKDAAKRIPGMELVF